MGEFRGARKITSLGCYPLEYHKNEAQLRKDLVARGKKFVELSGVHYKSHQGMAYYKKKKAIIKVNINGRIMIDPSIHRRINPNYPISIVRPKDHDVLSDGEESEAEPACSGCASGSENGGDQGEDGEQVMYVKKVFTDEKGKIRLARVPKSEVSDSDEAEKLDQVHGKGGRPLRSPTNQAESRERPPRRRQSSQMRST